MNTRDIVTITAICMVVFGSLPLGVAAVAPSSSGFDTSDSLDTWGGKTTPATASLWDRTGFDTTEDVITHGAGFPGVYVKYDNESSGWENLEGWLNDSDDRTLIRHDNASNYALVAVPGSHVRRSDVLSWGPSGLSTKAWVEWVEVEQRVELVDPVATESETSVLGDHGPTRTAKALAWLNDGDFVTDQGVAYSEDVNRTHYGQTKKTIAGDAASIPSTADGSNVTISVLDTGANVGDGAYEGLVFGNGTQNSTIRVEHGKNFVSGHSINYTAGNFSAIEDGNLHGTYTAARIAGASEGNTTTRALAHESELAIGKVLGDDGGGSIDQIVRGLEWSCSDPVSADVVSMSLGSPTYSKVLADQIHECFETSDVSAIVVAAGNARWTYGRANIGTPADVDGVIAVAATTNGTPATVESAYFSNTGLDGGVADGSGRQTAGENVDVGAPGMANTITIVSSSGNTRDYSVSGTSMSTPDVAATAAILLDENPSLEGDHGEVRTRILHSASAAPLMGVSETGHGLLNVSNALADRRPTLDQEQARNEQAVARDNANYALGGSFARWLKSQGINL